MRYASGIVAAILAFARQDAEPGTMRYVEPYSFTLNRSLSSGAGAAGQIQISRDADFLLTSIQGQTYDATAPATLVAGRPVTVEITETGSGRNLFEGAQPLEVFAGTGEEKGVLVYPREIAAGSTLTVELTDLGSSNGTNVYLTLEGVKVYGARYMPDVVPVDPDTAAIAAAILSRR